MPGYSISDFLSRTAASFARPNLFEVVFFGFPFEVGKTEDQKFSLNCHTVSIPGKSIATSERDKGFRSYPYQRLFNDITMQFYASTDMSELKLLQQWMDLIISGPEDNSHVGYYDDIVTDIEIRQLDRQQKVTTITQLIESYPKEISNIELSYGTTGSIINVSATFTYRHYEQYFPEGQGIGTIKTKPKGKPKKNQAIPSLDKEISGLEQLKNQTGARFGFAP